MNGGIAVRIVKALPLAFARASLVNQGTYNLGGWSALSQARSSLQKALENKVEARGLVRHFDDVGRGFF